MQFPQATRVLIAANPNSGSRDRTDLIHSLRDKLIEHGLTPDIVYDLDQLQSRMAQEHQAGTLRAVVAAGGDGTASAVASRSEPDVPISILPLGTENLLSKYLGIACDPVAVANAVLQRSTRRLDCGMANGKLFLIMVGIGFDAAVVMEMAKNRRGHIRHWSYAGPIARSVLSYRFPKLSITASSNEESVSKWDAHWAFIANLPRYAASLPIASWADSNDGLLDVCSFRGGGVTRSLRYLMFLAMNRHRKLASFRTMAAESITIESQTPANYQIDGDFGGELPLEVHVLPARLNVITAAIQNG